MALWDALLEVRTAKRAKLVLIEGEPGVGKSRLAEWLVERAHETGAANILHVQHNELVATQGRVVDFRRRNGCGRPDYALRRGHPRGRARR